MDVVVTVPLSFGLATWIAEGDAAGEPWSGQEWHFYLGGHAPDIEPGERVYVVYNRRLRGYAPLVRVEWQRTDMAHPHKRFGKFSLVRHGGAQAVTIEQVLKGFRGWRFRWWDRTIEIPFPEWREP